MFIFGSYKARRAVRWQIYCACFLLILLAMPNFVFADACRQASKDLRASFEVTQGRGGIWGYMEQNSSLRSESMIGFQIDGKLQRIIVIFEDHCQKAKNPSQPKYDRILSILGDARMIFNLRPGKSSVKDIMAKINGLNTDLDKLIQELES